MKETIAEYSIAAFLCGIVGILALLFGCATTPMTPIQCDQIKTYIKTCEKELKVADPGSAAMKYWAMAKIGAEGSLAANCAVTK